ncbi:MAG: YigZ family protein [Arachnia propionica]|uniref:IMPACT family protein n=1 Tax=Arachnia propionica TaxID=1750 RepID=UPI0026F691BE|nr:YigZ family protein [Arachnia propionica]
MSEHFLTIDAGVGAGVDVELEIKRSRFLTRLRRVTSETEARAVVEERRSAHFDANHHCSAFVLGPDARTARSSDDGEPAGTAGIPMLGVLNSNSLTDVVAVVTRYFGGVKLGAGGLVRAYSDAVAQAVQAAGVRTVERRHLLSIEVDFATIGALEGALRGMVLPSGTAVMVEGVEWAECARIDVAIPEAALAEFDAALAALSAGSLTATRSGERWIDHEN